MDWIEALNTPAMVIAAIIVICVFIALLSYTQKTAGIVFNALGTAAVGSLSWLMLWGLFSSWFGPQSTSLSFWLSIIVAAAFVVGTKFVIYKFFDD